MCVRRRRAPLKPHLELAQLPFQRLVFGADPAKVDVAVPRTAYAARAVGCGTLHFGERAEGGHFEQRHAGARVHLCGNQNDVAEHHGDEQDGGALADIGEGHWFFADGFRLRALGPAQSL